jgi:hypothetical protein
MNISSTTSSWSKSLSFNSSAVRRLLISVESPNDYLISAAAPLQGGYLVPGDGSCTFSVGSTLAFHPEVHLVPFATIAAMHSPTGFMAPAAMMNDEFALIWAACEVRRINGFWLFLFLAAHVDAA